MRVHRARFAIERVSPDSPDQFSSGQGGAGLLEQTSEKRAFSDRQVDFLLADDRLAFLDVDNQTVACAPFPPSLHGV